MAGQPYDAHGQGCLVCGAELLYGKARLRSCHYCGVEEHGEAACENGHFICDGCHALPAEELIITSCLASEEKDPLRLAEDLMRDPRVKMHGPEHHFLVPAVLLSAISNLRGEKKLKARRLELARERAGQVRGGFCGHHGACGAGIGAGIFVSVLLEASPLSSREWQLANLATANALQKIAAPGGPRCCKRDTFLAVREAVAFVEEHFAEKLPVSERVQCHFHARNRECLLSGCPFYP